jgi:hypothetical protein
LILEDRNYLVDVTDVAAENIDEDDEFAENFDDDLDEEVDDTVADDDEAAEDTESATQNKTKQRIAEMDKKVLPFQRFSKETFIPQMMKDSQKYMAEMIRLFKIFTQSYMRLTIQNFFNELEQDVGREFWNYLKKDEEWSARKEELCVNQSMLIVNEKLKVLAEQEAKILEFEGAVNDVRY